jgi:hypothetical protein
MNVKNVQEEEVEEEQWVVYHNCDCDCYCSNNLRDVDVIEGGM